MHRSTFLKLAGGAAVSLAGASVLGLSKNQSELGNISLMSDVIGGKYNLGEKINFNDKTYENYLAEIEKYTGVAHGETSLVDFAHKTKRVLHRAPENLCMGSLLKPIVMQEMNERGLLAGDDPSLLSESLVKILKMSSDDELIRIIKMNTSENPRSFIKKILDSHDLNPQKRTEPPWICDTAQLSAWLLNHVPLIQGEILSPMSTNMQSGPQGEWYGVNTVLEQNDKPHAYFKLGIYKLEDTYFNSFMCWDRESGIVGFSRSAIGQEKMTHEYMLLAAAGWAHLRV